MDDYSPTHNRRQMPGKQTALPRERPKKSIRTMDSMISHLTHNRPTVTHSSQAKEPNLTLASPASSVSSHLAPVPISTARTAAILKTRARALARVTEQHSAEERGLSVIEFLVGSARYALPASYVREVYRFKELTPLPHTPASIAGIINVRGLMLAVIDIQPLLALPPVAQAKQMAVIILHAPGREVGVLTHGMLGMQTIPLSQLHPASQTLSHTPLEYVRGVTNTQLIVIDAEQLLVHPTAPTTPPKERSGSSLLSTPAAGQAS